MGEYRSVAPENIQLSDTDFLIKNISPHYAPMLMAEALVKLTKMIELGHAGSIVPKELLEERVARTLVQYSVRTLQTQNLNGSWGSVGPREETAYAILGLTAVLKFSIVSAYCTRIVEAITKGRQFLLSVDLDSPPERLWVEKVLFGSKVLSAAYTLSAIKVDVPKALEISAGSSIDASFVEKLDKSSVLFKQLPVLKDCPHWILKASQVEAQTYIPALKRMRGAIFTREGFTDDKYFSWIPVIWTTANNFRGGCIAPAAMFDMMVVSVVNFQVDEFMESVVASEFSDYHAEINDWVRSYARCGYASLLESDGTSNGCGDKIRDDDNNPDSLSNGQMQPTLDIPRAERVTGPLLVFLQFVMSHPQVRNSSKHDREKLKTQIIEFLVAHLSQNEDNAKFAL